MVRPECYRCARCGKSWREFFPRVVCPCGCEVLRTYEPIATDPEPFRSCLARGEFALAVSRAWSPYPLGNGTEGAHA